ncbi:glycosyltransferase family 4 protein [Acidobacteria bacterium AH-259-A15]|nr:glycosyltransferase family 4 protein [Acidobacteria bacterium AH-259-L09]MDA2937595.1 glycosyltransferase family 4 protein [Acidobacteria bacterium AH-259-A15]
MNIALLHYSCPPVVGGVEEVVHQQASLFHRYFHNVKVLAGRGKQLTTDFPVEINPLLGSRCPQILKVHQALLESGNRRELDCSVRDIHQYLNTALEGFDVLIAHNVLTMRYNLPLTLALARLAAQDLWPLVSWNHDSPYFYSGYPDYLDEPPWNVLKRPLEKVHYVVISESRCVEFSKLYETADLIHIVPNGIDPIAFFQLDPLTVRLIQEQRLFEVDFLMVQPTRLHPRKNIELSIRVTRALHERGVQARLLVTGAYDAHGPETIEYYQKLRSLSQQLSIERDVLIMAEYFFKSGQQLTPDRITMRDLYLIADLIFLPSLQEGFGIPLLESGMIRVPVVCSDIPAFRELGQEDVCFFKLDESAEAIAGKILNFLAGLKSRRLFRRTIKNYVWDNIYHSRLLPLLEQIQNKT